MRIIHSSIFPSAAGNLVFGRYPHRMTLKDSAKLASVYRQPFLVVEMIGEEMVCRAAQDTAERAIRYMKPDRWLVFPVGYSGDTSFIYGE
jgi:hypothetical protein